MTWQLADAKNRFSELVRRALSEGPQRISRRDQAVVLISEEDYLRLTGKKPSLATYLAAAADDLRGLELDRDKSPMRELKF